MPLLPKGFLQTMAVAIPAVVAADGIEEVKELGLFWLNPRERKVDLVLL